MSADRHERLGQLFLSASRLPDLEREAFLRESCGGDVELLLELRAMLGAHGEETSSLDQPIISQTLQADLLAAPQDTAHPIAIGGYRILKVLGVGGMGVVYLAEQDRPRRTIALKVIKPGMTSPTLLRRFELEQEVLGRLQHPGIAQIFEAGVHKPDETENRRLWQPFFAMEYVQGLALTEYCDTNRLGTRARLALVVKVCDAVQHAHVRGVIHRDLKPGNILVDSEGQPKILDFGVARSTGSDVQVTTLHTDVGQLVGTIPYMSPEQVAGDPSQIDTRSDVYALGVIAYQLLANRLPHDVKGRTIPEAARIIIDTEPLPLSSVDRALRGDLDTLISKALEKDRGRRYQSAADLGADIERYLRDEPIVARPPSRAYQVAKFAKRNKPLVAGLALSFVFLVVGLVSTTIFMLKFLDERNTAQTAEKNANRRFDQLRQFANFVMHDLYDQVLVLQGSTKVRQTIITNAQKYLDGLAAEASDIPELQIELAEAYSRLGDVMGNPDRPNLGDYEGAMKSYVKAEEIRKKLLAAEPSLYKNRRGITLSHNSIGRMLEVMNHSDEALERYKKSLEIRMQLAAEAPENPDRQRDLAIIRQSIGNVHMNAKRFPEAIEQYMKQLETSRRLVELSPKDDRARRDLGVALEKLGDILRNMDRNTESLPYYEECIALRKKIVAEQPHNAEAMSDLAIGASKLGELLVKLDRADEALALDQEAYRQIKTIVDADPDDVKSRSNLVVTGYKLALVYSSIGADEKRTTAARLAAYREAVVSIDLGLELLNTLRRAGRLAANMSTWSEELGKTQHEAVLAIEGLGGEAPATGPATAPATLPASGSGNGS